MTSPYKKGPPPLVTVEMLEQMNRKLDDLRWYELDEGVLTLCEPSGMEHAGIGTELIVAMGSYVKSQQLGRVFGADGTYVLNRNPDTVRVPDVSFVRADRFPNGRLTPKFYEGTPDLVVEIISPTDRFTAVERKVQQYLKAGTQLVWVIRPVDMTAIVYRQDGSTQKLGSHDSFDGEAVIPGFSVNVSSLFV